MKSKVLFFIVWFYFISYANLSAYQQTDLKLNQYEDSLRVLFQSGVVNPEAQVNQLFHLAELYFYSNNPFKGLEIIQEALDRTDSLGYKEYVSYYYLALSAFFGDELSDFKYYYKKKAVINFQNKLSSNTVQKQIKNEFSSSVLETDKSIALLKRSLSSLPKKLNSEVQSAILYKLGYLYLLKGELEEANTYFDKSAEIFNKNGDYVAVFLCLGQIEFILNTLEKFDKVRSIEQEMKSILFRKADDSYYGLLSKVMASSYAKQGRFINSVEYYLKSIESFIQSRELELLPDLYRDLGIAYENLYLFDKSAESFSSSIQILSSLGEKHRFVELYIFMIFPLIEMEKYDEAQHYIELAEEDSVFVKTAFHYARLADARGQILMKQGKYHEAITYFERALKGFESIEQTHWGIPYVLLNISASYGHIGQTEKALKFALDAKGLIFSGELKLARRTNQLISKLYETKGDFSPALRYLKEYEKIVESSNKDDELRILANAEIQAILERSNREIEALEKEQQLAEQINTTQRLWLTVFLGALLFTLVIAYVLFRNYRIKMNANSRLLREKEKVELTLEKLKATQEQLIEQEKLASLGQLTAGIAHEIKNPLNFVTNYSELGKELLIELESAIQKNDLNEIQEVMSDLDRSLETINKNGKRADIIVKGMLQHSRNGSVDKTKTDINELSKEYLQLAYHAQKAINQGFRIDVETVLDPELGAKTINAQDIGRVILNIISNALYAVADKQKKSEGNYIPKVKLITLSGTEMFRIAVQDNGSGIPDEIKDKIFEPFFTTKKGKDGTGLGLSISYDIVKAHGGRLEIQSDENGTIATIFLPN